MSSDWAHSTGVSQPDTLRKRTKASEDENVEELDVIIQQTSSLSLDEKTPRSQLAHNMIYYVNPILLTLVSGAVRLYGIGDSKRVVWDEAHFGKFGSYYLKHEFYFDVHPPLGKLLVGLSGWLANYDGSFMFESGKAFPEDQNIVFMRVFNCVFGILCTPLAYFTAVELGFSQLSVWFVSLLVAFEMMSLTLSKFILLDSMLLLFTVSTFFGLVKIHTLRHGDGLISGKGFLWLVYTGVSIGCVCSVKWVGLFVTLLVGFYTIYDLGVRFFQTSTTKKEFSLTWTKYLLHWIFRIVCLIAIPFLIYVAAFKVHFAVLSRSGPGDGSISTLLQASLEGNTLSDGPRSVAFGSLITLRSQGLSPNLLHSHPLRYPEGSGQQQITTYGFKDSNNEFLVEFDVNTMLTEHRYATLEYDEDHPEYVLDIKSLLKDGDTIRLMHKETGCFLHSHPITAHVLKSSYEASCYGSLDIADQKDDWVIEVQTQDVSPAAEFANEDKNAIHPISTNFRLRHKTLGCYLATTGYLYPAWGFQQGEVVCKNAFLAKDKSTWWNIEKHVNNAFPTPNTTYVAPKPKFWKEFILLNYGMMASNNALIPDPDHRDTLASSWWEWPILKNGLRMGSWGTKERRYLLIGHPFVTFFSTASIPLAALSIFTIILQWQRQKVDLSVYGAEWGFVLSAGILPLAGWFLHYLPFVVMGRVTYLHHYVPALYFAIFVSGFLMEYYIARRTPKYIKYAVFALVYVGVVGGFAYYYPFSLGMTGGTRKYNHLKLRRSWQV